MMGTMGFGYIWPYSGLIGSSPGVYGLVGACIVMILFHSDRLDPVFRVGLPFILIVHLLGDVVMYIFYYNESTGYVSHLVGLLAGFCLALIISGLYGQYTDCKDRNKRIVSHRDSREIYRTQLASSSPSNSTNTNSHNHPNRGISSVSVTTTSTTVPISSNCTSTNSSALCPGICNRNFSNNRRCYVPRVSVILRLLIGLTGFILIVCYFVYYYVDGYLKQDLPQPYRAGWLHNSHQIAGGRTYPCCAQLADFLDNHPSMSKAEVISNSYCINSVLQTPY